MDILSDIFDTIDLRGTLYFHTDFSPPWGVTVPALGQAARFHLVLAGECWLQVASNPPQRLAAGDFALVPGGASHVLTSHPDSAAPPLESVLETARFDGHGTLVLPGGDPGAASRLICGHVSFGRAADHPLLRAMPELIVIRAEERARRPWLDMVLTLLATSLFQDPGALSGVVRRLSEVVLMEALRSAGDEAPEVRRLLAGFADLRIGRAVTAIHRHPERDWTIDTLARAAAMSRTRFAARFRALIGATPMAYLGAWRLQRAAVLLTRTNRGIADIAHSCGYRSAASFSRAFAERFGMTPRGFRQRRGDS